MWIKCFIIICSLIKYIKPQPWPSLHGYPIEADCMAIFGRNQVFPIVGLESLSITDVELTRHHIIPVNTLRDFFNAAVRRNRQAEGNVELSGIMNLFGFLSNDSLNRYINVEPSIRQQIVSDLQAAVRTQQLYAMGQNPPLVRLFDARVLVGSMFIWMPRNIFIGPSYRSDDPGPEFDDAARYIIDSELFGRLETINRMMHHYIENNERATFNEIVELLSEIAQEEGLPHPYRADDWEETGTRTSRRGNQITEYRVRRDRQSRNVRSIAEEQKVINKDPYCLMPLEIVKATLIEKNLVIAVMIIERVNTNKGFYTRDDYSSWKEWYGSSSWSGALYDGIYWTGRSMAGISTIYNPYGYIFADGSASVGVIGKDAAYGKDNWTHQTNWMYGDADEYCGQMFFDKTGRPVAIAITTQNEASWGAGWSFVYKAGAWEYHSTDGWHEEDFSGTTLTLDHSAPRFEIIPREKRDDL